MAYEIKALTEELKAKGLDVAEEAAMSVLEAIEAWAVKSAQEGSKPLVDGMVLALVPMGIKIAKEQADKIDGEKDL